MTARQGRNWTIKECFRSKTAPDKGVMAYYWYKFKLPLPPAVIKTSLYPTIKAQSEARTRQAMSNESAWIEEDVFPSKLCFYALFQPNTRSPPLSEKCANRTHETCIHITSTIQGHKNSTLTANDLAMNLVNTTKALLEWYLPSSVVTTNLFIAMSLRSYSTHTI